MYGGQTYIKSAAAGTSRKNGLLFKEINEVSETGKLSYDSLFLTAEDKTTENPQSLAIQNSIDFWGADLHVCKKKYKPFTVTLETETTTTVSGKSSKNRKATTVTKLKRVQAERMFGCEHHHALRKAIIAKHGMRPGWYDFGAWSIEKACVRARDVWEEQASKRAAPLRSASGTPIPPPFIPSRSTSGSSSRHRPSSTSSTISTTSTSSGDVKTGKTTMTLQRSTDSTFDRMVCMGGNCVWKKSSNFDDVKEQVNKYDGKCVGQFQRSPANSKSAKKRKR